MLALVGVTAVWLAALATPALGALAPDTSATADAARELDQAQSRGARPPAPIRGRGYRVVFHDGFKRFRRHVWTRRIWYDPAPPRGSIFTRKGKLHLVSRRGDGHPNISVTTLKSRSFRRGYFEARMRWTGGNGGWPAFWLFSTRHAKNPAWPNINPYCGRHGLPAARCWAAELDVFEGQGSLPRTFFGTLHRNTGNEYHQNSEQTNNPSWHTVRPNLTRRYHVYAARWTASRVTWYLDGKRVLSTPAFDSTDQPLFLILDMWTCGWESSNRCDSSTGNLELTVDWVKVWRQ